MKHKRILTVLIIVLVAVIAFTLGMAFGKIQIHKYPEPSSSEPEALGSTSQAITESEDPSSTVQEESSLPEDAVSMTCRIVSGAEDEQLMIADLGENGSIYYLSTKDLPLQYEDSNVNALEDGMQIEILWSGVVLETYPAQLGAIYRVTVLKDGMDTLCTEYLDVLNDLWKIDPGLNDDITELGVDLSQTRLTPSEQSALAWTFGNQHHLTPIEGTFDELAEQGFIDKENLNWKNGCLFSITETQSDDNKITFDAEKWRSGLAAYFYMDCKITRSADGHWSDYTIGAEAIS